MEFTEAELSFLQQKVNADLLTYLGHYGRGSLFPKEVEHMEWLKKLSDKLEKIVAVG